MKRPPLYSRSRSDAPGPFPGLGESGETHAGGGRQAGETRSDGGWEPTDARTEGGRGPLESAEGRSGRAGGMRARLAGLRARVRRRAPILAGGALAVILLFLLFRPGPAPLTQRDIDLAVLHTLENIPTPPSLESVVYETIAPSVVRVRGVGGEEGEGELDLGGGTGVVITEDGTILTNLHVVLGAERLRVVFWDGTESPASVVGVEPDQDLAVIRATLLPDDLIPATLASTRDLRVGDRVIAVGFPFGIGPSLSSGVVSGMRREYVSPEGERLLTNLIQFDAAANPGNSGGPLVNQEGHVVGIVTAILNPLRQRVFIGIGFAVPIETAMRSVGPSPF